MKKMLFVILLIVVAMIGTVYAAPGNGNGNGNGYGREFAFGLHKDFMRNPSYNNGWKFGATQFLVLIGKDSSDWSYQPANGVGLLMYGGVNRNKIGLFTFTGYGLQAGTNYALVSYDEPWPGVECKVLGTGTANTKGVVNIAGSGKLACNNYKGFSTGDYTSGRGSKIWLVPTSNLTGGTTAPFIAWTPGTYLFETDLINKGCTPNTATEGPD